MEKLIKTAKGLDVFVKIISIITLVGAIICAVAAVLLPIFGGNMLSGPLDSVTFGNVTFHLAPDALPQDVEIPIGAIVATLVGALAVLAFTYAFLLILRKILRPMKEGRPFEGAVSRHLQTRAWLTLGGGIVSSIIMGVADYCWVRFWEVSAIFPAEMIDGWEIDYGFDLTFVVGFAVLFLLSYVFRYGEELQKQSDETL